MIKRLVSGWKRRTQLRARRRRIAAMREILRERGEHGLTLLFLEVRVAAHEEWVEESVGAVRDELTKRLMRAVDTPAHLLSLDKW